MEKLAATKFFLAFLDSLDLFYLLSYLLLFPTKLKLCGFWKSWIINSNTFIKAKLL